MGPDHNLAQQTAPGSARAARPFINVTRPIVFWFAIFAALIALMVLLHEMLLPFVGGMALAYLLDPLATRMERLGMNRLVATLTIVALSIVGVIAPIALAGPVIIRELAHFIDDLPLYVRQLRELATDEHRPWLSKIVGDGLGQAERSFGELTTLATDWIGAFLQSVWSGDRGLVSVLSLLIVTPIVACYLIYDWNEMTAIVARWVPPARRETVLALAREVDDTIRRFVFGQGALCIVLGLFYMIALSLIGLKHGLLIGLVVGLISFVPYLGSLTGIVVSTCVAIAQFWPNWLHILIVPAIFFVGQSLSDYVLSPYLVGRRVNLSPVWVLFALFAFGHLFGFVGLVIAVPLAAAIGVLMRFAFRQYYASALYAAPTTSTVDAECSTHSDSPTG